MHTTIDKLFFLLGSHPSVANALGYTDRQYRNIRRKIMQGEELPARIQSLIRMKLQEVQTQFEAGDFSCLPDKEKNEMPHARRP